LGYVDGRKEGRKKGRKEGRKMRKPNTYLLVICGGYTFKTEVLAI
jgi:hypothetical protein